jgi:hypothetical protein
VADPVSFLLAHIFPWPCILRSSGADDRQVIGAAFLTSRSLGPDPFVPGDGYRGFWEVSGVSSARTVKKTGRWAGNIKIMFLSFHYGWLVTTAFGSDRLNHTPRGPCFIARGVTPCTSGGSELGACARVLHSSNQQQHQINSSRPYLFFAIALDPVAIGMTSSTRPAESFFYNEFAHISV